MSDRDAFEPRVAVHQLRQVPGDWVLDAPDQALVDRDPHERRDERLGHGERGLQRLSVGGPEVPLVDQPILMDDQERVCFCATQEVIESCGPAGRSDRHGIDRDLGRFAEGTGIATGRY